jgi:hypothetical protein
MPTSQNTVDTDMAGTDTCSSEVWELGDSESFSLAMTVDCPGNMITGNDVNI